MHTRPVGYQPVKHMRLGSVSVDSGRLVIIDPGYLKLARPNSLWPTTLDRGEHNAKEVLISGTATAMIVSSGLGDGHYDVEAEVIETPAWGGSRIKRLTITFIEDDDEV